MRLHDYNYNARFRDFETKKSILNDLYMLMVDFPEIRRENMNSSCDALLLILRSDDIIRLFEQNGRLLSKSAILF